MSATYIAMSDGLTEVVKRAATDAGISVSALARFALMEKLGVDANGNPVSETGGLPTPPRRQPAAKRTAPPAGGNRAVQFSGREDSDGDR